MSFCMNCGAKLPEGSAFCTQCGTPVNGTQAVVVNSQPANISTQPVPQSAQDYLLHYENNKLAESQGARMASYEEIARMAAYFGQKGDLYDEYDRVNDQLDAMAKYRRPGLRAWGIIFLCIGIFALFIAATVILAASSGKEIVRADIDNIVVLLILPVIFLGVGILMLCLYSGSKKKTRKNIEQLTDRVGELTEQLSEYYQQYGYCMVGLEYTNPKILQHMAELIRQGRADTPKEAINIMIEDAHRSEMEMMQMQTMRAARAASRKSGVAAGFAAASFFL